MREQKMALPRGTFGLAILKVETVMSDLRSGARMLRKNPAFTTLAVLTLALGIGASSSVFSPLQGVLLSRPLIPTRLYEKAPSNLSLARGLSGAS
jgi:hypothetical protein